MRQIDVSMWMGAHPKQEFSRMERISLQQKGHGLMIAVHMAHPIHAFSFRRCVLGPSVSHLFLSQKHTKAMEKRPTSRPPTQVHRARLARSAGGEDAQDELAEETVLQVGCKRKRGAVLEAQLKGVRRATSKSCEQ